MSQDEVEEVLDADLSEVPADQYGAETGAYDSQATYEFQGAATAEAFNISNHVKDFVSSKYKRVTDRNGDERLVKRDGEEHDGSTNEFDDANDNNPMGGIGL